MAISWELISRNYEHLIDFGDPVMKQFPMMNSPLIPAILIMAYLFMVIIGPKIMESKKPFQLRWTLVAYNISLALINLILAIQVIRTVIKINYNWICQPSHPITNEDHHWLALQYYIFFLSKFYEFFDTIFFILRKKSNQLSALHIYHHVSVPTLGWILLKIQPTGTTFMVILINSTVHVVMYAYYGVAALGPRAKRYLWWKKYLTILQLVQFTFGIGMMINLTFISKCYSLPKTIKQVVVPYLFTLIVLFARFYIKTYGNNEVTGDRKGK